MNRENFDVNAFMKEAGDPIRAGKPLTGEGVFTPLIKKFLDASLAGEMDQHLKAARK